MTPTPRRILIAGIGNIFLGDDGFGSEVARRMIGLPLPEGVKVIDYGIRGFDVAYAIMDGYDVTILVDATSRGGAVGTLYVIEPDLSELDVPQSMSAPLDTHAMTPDGVLRLVKTMGGQFNKILVVGCEPQDFGPPDEGRMGLSPAITAAIEPAIELIESLLKRV